MIFAVIHVNIMMVMERSSWLFYEVDGSSRVYCAYDTLPSHDSHDR